MKQKVLTVAFAVIMLGVTGSVTTLSYFTDTSEATNNFTVGNVDVQFFRWYSPIARFYNAEEAPGVNQRYDDWLGAKSNMLIGGKSINLYPYISNTGNIDVYVRLRMYIPSELYNNDYVTFDQAEGIVSISAENQDNTEWLRASKDVDIDGKAYREVTYYRKEPLAPKHQSSVAPISSMGLSKKVIGEDVDLGGFVDENGKLAVKMAADAVQSYGFDTAVKAFQFIDNK
ncbi:MAG: SipW-dependent-type signal peptide-containing protein [Candidatus Saccharibacteria bacterium]|nr:SipW-dependent-type signal peptide-containing protein [Candidatus Saccharibacteria bacterium]